MIEKSRPANLEELVLGCGLGMYRPEAVGRRRRQCGKFHQPAFSKRSMALSITIENQGRSIQVHCDEAGLDALIAALQGARTAGHLHVRSPANGGKVLDDQDPWGNPAIGELIVTLGGD